MKAINLLKGMLIIMLLTSTATVFGQDKIVSYSEVPSSIQSYVKKHFPQSKVLQAGYEYERLKKEYEVILSDNIKLKFNGKNVIKNIEAKTELPASVIPSKIRSYVKSNFPTNFITEWDLDKRKQTIKLDNKIELEFTLKGEFLKIDN